MQSLAWVILAIVALPTVIGSCMAIQKAVHIWNKDETITIAKTCQVASNASVARYSFEIILDQWVREASKTEDRVTAKQKILDFYTSSGQETCLMLSNLGLTSLPNIFHDPCFSRLKRLCLAKNHLKTIPNTVGCLKAIEWLELQNNKLIALPQEIGKLRKLKVLNLHHNLLNSLPQEVGNLFNLEWLILNHNMLTDLPKEIGTLEKLKTLHLHYNQLSRLPQEIGDLQSLEWLNLEGNQLKSIAYTVGNLRGLTWLNLKNNQLESFQLKTLHPTFSEIARDFTEKSIKLPALKWLNLEDNQLKSLPDEIGDLQSLEWLSLNRNKLTNLPSAFNKLKKLQTLYLNRNQLTHLLDKFSMLQGLKTLDISHNQLVKLPYTIKELQALEWLNASHNKLKIFSLENFQLGSKGLRRLPMLKCLNLSHNELTEVPRKIGKVLNLEKCNISHNKLEKTVSKEIGKLFLLEELDLSHNYIENLPDEIGDLVKLKELRLNSNEIEHLPHTMGNLKHLEKLYVSHNKMKTLTYGVSKLASLKELDASYNQLIALPGKMGDLKALEWLNLSCNSYLRSFPLVKITGLSNNCEIELTGCKLFTKTQLRLQEILGRPNYKGPLIAYSEITQRPLEESLTHLYGLVHKKPVDLANLEETSELLSWLHQMANVNEASAHKMINYLEHANEDPEFCEIFYAIIKDASRGSKGNQLEIAMLNLHLAYERSTIVLNDISDVRALADFLKGVWAVSMLGQIARDKVPTFPAFDKTGASLGFLHPFIKKLNPSTGVQDMLYFTCSALQQEDLRKAEKFIVNKEAYLEFLVNNDKWQEGIKLIYPKEWAIIESKRKKDADRNDLTKENKALIKQQFDREIKALTKRALLL